MKHDDVDAGGQKFIGARVPFTTLSGMDFARWLNATLDGSGSIQPAVGFLRDALDEAVGRAIQRDPSRAAKLLAAAEMVRPELDAGLVARWLFDNGLGEIAVEAGWSDTELAGEVPAPEEPAKPVRKPRSR